MTKTLTKTMKSEGSERRNEQRYTSRQKERYETLRRKTIRSLKKSGSL